MQNSDQKRIFHSEETVAASISFNCPQCSSRLTLPGLSAEGNCPRCQTHIQVTTTISTPTAPPNKKVKQDRFFRPTSKANAKQRHSYTKTHNPI